MDVLALTRPRLRTYLWVCGLTFALGWGFRNRIDWPAGAMLPGALGVFAVALVTTDEWKRARVARMALLSAIATLACGAFSMESAIAFLAEPRTMLRGLYLLAAKGAIMGGLLGIALGTSVSPIRYRFRDLLGLILVAGAAVAAGFLPQTTSSDSDHAPTLGMVLLALLAALYFLKRDRATLWVALCGAFGVGGGLAACATLNLWYPWLPADALTGLCAGLALGLAVFVLDEDMTGPAPSRSGPFTWAGLLLAVWTVPFLGGLDVLAEWTAAGQAPLWGVALAVATAIVALAIAAVLAELHPARMAAITVTAAGLAFLTPTAYLLQLCTHQESNTSGLGNALLNRGALAACVFLSAYALWRRHRAVSR